MASVARNLKFVRDVLKERTALRSLLESNNIKFIRDFSPGHFYSPLPDAHEIRRNAKGIFDRSAREIEGIDLNEKAQVEFLDRAVDLYDDIPFPAQRSDRYRYFFDNGFFSYGDGVALYLFLRHFRPKRVIEVGSGFSSAAMLDVNDLFLDGSIEFTFIEPFPDRLFSLLSEEDRKQVKLEIKPVQAVSPEIFSSLEENDILFIDSSHVAKVNSDVLHLLFKVLPRLRKGVIVHFHDVLWPFEYLEEWLEEGRAWNEAYFLRSFLQFNRTFAIVFFNSYMALHHAEKVEESMPLMLKKPSAKETPGNTSLWLRKVL